MEESTEDSMFFDFVWLDGGTKLVETGRNVDIREGEPKEERCAVLYTIYTQYIYIAIYKYTNIYIHHIFIIDRYDTYIYIYMYIHTLSTLSAHVPEVSR